MFWRIVVVGFALILPIYGQNKSTTAAANKHDATPGSKTGTPSTPSVVNVINQQPTDQNSGGSANHPNSYFARLFSPENLPNILLFCVAAFGIRVAIRTLRAIKTQAELQERSIRPWVGTDFIENGIVTIEQGRVHVHTEKISLKNTGPSIAMDGLMLAHLISSRTSELQQGIEAAWKLTRQQLTNRNLQEWESGFVLHPTRSHNHPASMGTSMGLTELQAGICYVLVCIIYRDQFEKDHTTQDCFRVVCKPVPPHALQSDAKPVEFIAVPAHQRAT